MKRLNKATPWIAGILLASLLFAVLLSFNMLLYSGSDDAPILREYMGFEGGEPATFSMLIHPVMGWTLYGLAKLFPGVAWFSIFQLFFLWLSSVVVVKSLTRCAALHGRSQWLGATLGALTIVAGAFWISMRISFTTTAAWLGAAAVAQLSSIDWANGGKRAIRRGMGLSAALLLFCYFLRQVSVLPPLAFWLTGLFIVWLSYRKQARQPLLKPILAGVAVCAALLLVFTGVRFAETKLLDVEDVYAWSDASGNILDYSDTKKTVPTDDALAEIGWPRETYTMFTYWYFMDDVMTTDSMTRLYESTFEPSGQTAGEKLQSAVSLIRTTMRNTPSQAYGVWFALAAAALSLLLAAMRGFRKPFRWLGALAAPVLGALLLGFLGWEGRLPMRAMLSVTLPMMTLSVWMLCLNLEPTEGARVRNLIGLLLCALLIYPAAQGAAHAWDESQKTLLAAENELETNETFISEDLDTYAAENPDTLFIYDLSLMSDYRLFPNVPEELVGNVMFWGGHTARTPGWYGVLAKYGVTELDATIFLRNDVLLASINPEPWPGMTEYVAQAAQADVDWEYYDTYGMIYFYHFYID